MAEAVDPTSKPEPPGRRGNAKIIIVTALVSTLVAIGCVALLVSIFEHKQEARNPFYRVVEISLILPAQPDQVSGLPE